MADSIQKIRSASKSDIHKITSGQVIIDLESAVKELVENSLDAKSTNIDITFKNYGLEFVEVSDDGTGIAEPDFNSIARKYHTSKLSSFDDIMESVNTFGFRGEAVSSLCYISNVKMVTCTKDTEPRAKYLEFDNMGNIFNKKDTSRQKGTTTTFSNIFANLPVRRKIYLKNLKKEFSKAVNFLQNYCIVSEGVKISVYNIPTERSGKKLLFSTTKNSNMLDNIVSIYGVIMKKLLIPIDFDVQISRKRKKVDFDQYIDKDVEGFQNNSLYSFSLQISSSLSQSENQVNESEGEDSLNNDDEIMNFKLKGYISLHSFGFGRNVSDRQLFFINSRPVTLPRFSRILNEVYRSFNRLQYPVVFLNVITDIKNLDINVTPDKKTVNIFNEAGLLEALRTKIMEMYDSFGDLMPSKGSVADEEKRSLPDLLAKAEEEAINKKRKTEVCASSNGQQISLDRFLNIDSQSANENAIDNFCFAENGETTNKLERNSIIDSASASSRSGLQGQKSQVGTNEAIEVDRTERNYIEKDYDIKKIEEDSPYGENKIDNDIDNSTNEEANEKEQMEDECSCCSDISQQSEQSNIEEVIRMYDSVVDAESSVKKSPIKNNDSTSFGKEKMKENSEDTKENNEDTKENNEDTKENNEELKAVLQKVYKLKGKKSSAIGIHNLQVYITSHFSRIKNNSKYYKLKQIGNAKDAVDSKFNSEESEESAEQKLSLSIKKQDFLKMRIIGQFNLGFIIVRKAETDDIFIVDQHASDEKFNFEKLTNETVLESQRLVISKKLELNSIEKVIVLDNLPIFHKNGFQVEHKCDQTTSEDILYLKSLPVSKNVVFNELDFHELVSMLKENQDMSISVLENLKIGKIRSILAMRACRSSIMIGKPLSEKTMVRVVRNLNGLDKPWNCPHGRPTMRHLTNLKNVKYFNSDYML